MRYFLDTEFIEAGHEHPVRLISIGIVSEDNREYYAECSETDLTLAGDWVKANVVPHLSGGAALKTRAQIREDILAFVGADEQPRFWAYFADYDWVVFCQIFGSMIELPPRFPHLCLDLQQRVLLLSLSRRDLPRQSAVAHNALNDAKWVKAASDHLDAVETSRIPAVPTDVAPTKE